MQLIKKVLLAIINQIDEGTCTLTEQQAEDTLRLLTFYSDNREKLSRTQAAKYLNMNLKTFDRYVKSGKIKQGQKILGFKEKFYIKEELDEVVGQ